ncbi:hypothetical protein MNBD_GAMMA09-1764 [hydrothermal vent metagenome]|uniref:Lipoprotein n=1 Tax=hydrothermal vent metagenome TaxID=652676 RepID=A0A3B0XYM8_9ZZZZ
MIKKWNISKFLFYVFGGACWFILLGILQARCIVNIPLYIDSLWVKPIGEGLVKNVIGATAFRVEGYGCEDQLIFVAQYYPNGMDGKTQIKSLASIVDVESWKKIESDTISTTYIDNSYKYVLFQTSDGVHMKVFQK